ncbi:hypothetical protein [Legionella sainthelensi]|uniref:hypothetical protein n=1 Tax=Legionella sainthelensi TaxID=28087 RepID=UPI000E1FE86A|nr:hypothetical protein [Legionella sainthelensi]
MDGETTQFTVNANPNYTVSQTVGGTCPQGIWSGNQYTTGAITNNCSVIFSATINIYTVTPGGDGHEIIDPGSPQQVDSGTTQKFTVTAKPGYTVAETVGGNCPLGIWNGNSYTTGVITSDCSVNFSASLITHTVTPSGDGHETIDPGSVQIVSEGSIQQFIVTPEMGYTVSQTVGGTCPQGFWSGSVYRTGAITNNCTVIFSATLNTYTVTPSGDGHETIDPDSSQTVSAGSVLQFIVNANPNYTVSQTVGGSCPQGNWNGNTYTTGAITNDCSVTFSATSNTYTVTPSGDGHETIDPDLPQAVSAGSMLEFTVNANTGYTVSQTVGGTCPQGTWSDNKYTTGAITNDCTVKFAAYNWTSWIENENNPIFPSAYYPSISYDPQRFGNSIGPLYKMWYQLGTGNGIGLAYSNDGVIWTNLGAVVSSGTHPFVVYDPNGFGETGGYNYKMWLWTGSPSIGDASSILYTKSQDGISWVTPQTITQNPMAPINTYTGYFYQLYGPGFVRYNPNATSPIPGQPFTYPYVMYFDTAAENTIPDVGSEQTGLAYSTDGIFWSAYSTQPVLIPSGGIEWDGQYIYRPSVVQVQGIYHMFYSGSDGIPDLCGNSTAHGIGHATSSDGVHWAKDTSPIFYIDEKEWRICRTYTPFVLYFPYCQNGAVAKMWFTGANIIDQKAIGYATIPCPTPLYNEKDNA